MTKKIQVGLIFGGNSSEYEVSIVSGHNIYKAIDKDNFNTIKDICKEISNALNST